MNCQPNQTSYKLQFWKHTSHFYFKALTCIMSVSQSVKLLVCTAWEGRTEVWEGGPVKVLRSGARLLWKKWDMYTF